MMLQRRLSESSCHAPRPARSVGRHRHSARPAKRLAVAVRAEQVLIVNTKSGGHAFIGLHLAKQLLAKGHSVTIFNDGDQAKLSKKGPYAQYSQLESEGVKVVFGNPEDKAALPSEKFDVIYDNNAKKLEVNQVLIDLAKEQGSHFVFVGSAGAYNADPIEPMHFEGDKRKSSAGHVAVEKHLASSGVPYTVFQPQYIYGPHTAKDCEQWFIERAIRQRPTPIPAPGIQLTTLTHVEDVASMMAAVRALYCSCLSNFFSLRSALVCNEAVLSAAEPQVPGNSAAVGQHYNVVSDRCISFDGIAKVVASALGQEPNIVHYDPAKMGLGKGEGFPFRTGHFFASASKAKAELGWQPQHTFSKDVSELVEAYRASGRADKEVDFAVDDKILAAVQ